MCEFNAYQPGGKRRRDVSGPKRGKSAPTRGVSKTIEDRGEYGEPEFGITAKEVGYRPSMRELGSASPRSS